MQGKTSMVIPCYNKENFIGAMIDTVIAQKWDNIELILVNDGSTDGTRKVIEAYIPKIKKRGYELKIIDQKNGGACNAVYNGLQQITGDYVSLVDADDELDPQYVSTMASWLEKHSDYEYCSCDFLFRKENGIQPFIGHPMYMDGAYTLELFLARNSNKAAWNFMVRRSYFQRCKIMENYVGLGQCSYEPGFCIPLAAYAGKMKAFTTPLYIYNISTDGMSRSENFEKYRNYCEIYHKLTLNALSVLPLEIMDRFKFNYYSSISYFYKLACLFKASQVIQDGNRMRNAIADEFLCFAKGWLGIDISYEAFGKEAILLRAIEAKLVRMIKNISHGQRIIGYGALGKIAQTILPQLEKSVYYPTELWDKKGDGIYVKKPDIASLTSNDIVLVFPSNKEIVAEIRETLIDCPSKVYFENEINYIIAELSFPQISKLRGL